MLRALHSAAAPGGRGWSDLFIGNQWRPSSTGDTFGVVNPATEQRLPIQERAAALLRFADALEPRGKEANDVC